MPAVNYKVNLPDYMAECEANYWRLLKLLPKQADMRAYDIELSDAHHARLTLYIEQHCPYTSMIRLEYNTDNVLGFAQVFEVRAYHDATLAEVIGFQQHRRVRPRYPYPNEKMYQQDEKRQQNRFLTELLIHCLKNGLAVSSDQLCES